MGEREGHLALAVALLSGASLGYELLLLRFFSLMYWDHFAHLILSMALLGFGASGTVLALSQQRFFSDVPRSFGRCCLLFVCALLAATTLAGRIGFNPPEVIWDSGQLLRLTAVFLVTTLPFLCAGLAIGLIMRHRSESATRIYQADLTGAACGALLVMGLLFVLKPQDSVRALALVAVAAALLIHPRRSAREWAILVLVVLLPLCWPSRWLTPVLSPFKGLSQTLHLPQIRIVGETHSPTGLYTVLGGGTVPFRTAPGLSMLAPAGPPEQMLLFRDGHPMGPVHDLRTGLEAMTFMRWTPMALPYGLVEHPRVLVLGAGGGGDVGHALLEGAEQVDAVEPHRELIDFISWQLRPFAGHLYDHDRVRLACGNVRGFLAARHHTYDLIQISPLGTATPPIGGGHALEPQSLYTVEGMHLALSRLSADGLLAISLELDLPPRAAVKLLATVVHALRRLGSVHDPSQHVAVIRAWNTLTLIASPAPLDPQRQTAIRAFCRSRSFDLDWLPGISATEVNRVNVLERPFVYEAALALWRGEEIAQLRPFLLTPPTDDCPWFSHFFRWRSFPTLWAQRAAGAAALLEWEYLLLWMSLGVALLTSLVAIVWPLLLAPRPLTPGQGKPQSPLMPQAIYFAALGLAFFFMEITFIQQFTLFLSDPMIAMAVVVPSFLFFAGCGSGLAGRLHTLPDLSGRWRNRPVLMAVGAMLLVAATFLWLLPLVFRVGAAWSLPLRIVVAIGLIAGLAVWMGMPFPLGLQRLGRHRPDLVPLAWAINGCCSVISTIAATILALHAGFQVVMAVALVLYLVAATMERRF
jgi:spermidine synthase